MYRRGYWQVTFSMALRLCITLALFAQFLCTNGFAFSLYLAPERFLSILSVVQIFIRPHLRCHDTIATAFPTSNLPSLQFISYDSTFKKLSVYVCDIMRSEHLSRTQKVYHKHAWVQADLLTLLSTPTPWHSHPQIYVRGTVAVLRLPLFPTHLQPPCSCSGNSLCLQCFHILST